MADPNQPAPTSFIDSPWTQVLVPLAATLATAIAPRHMGKAAAVGLSGWQGVNEWRGQDKRLQLLDQKRQEKLADDAAFEQQLNSLGDPKTPADQAPAGGSGPQATENAQNEALAAGHPDARGSSLQIDPQMKRLIIAAHKDDPAMGRKMLDDEVKRLQSRADAPDYGTMFDLHAKDRSVGIKGKMASGIEANFPAIPAHWTNQETGGRNQSSLITADHPMENFDRGPIQPKYEFKPDEETGTLYRTNDVTGEYGVAPMEKRGGGARLQQAGTSPQGASPSPKAPPSDILSGGSLGGILSSLPAGKPATNVAPAAPAPGLGGAHFGAGGSPEKRTLREAQAAWNQAHPDAGPIERKVAEVFLTKGISTDDLDPLADSLAMQDPNSLVDVGKAIGRGAEVRAYIYGRAARVAAQNGLKFNPALNDRKIALMSEYSDPKTPPGRTVQAYNTAMRHAARATIAVQKLADTGVPVFNMPLREFLTKFVGSDAQVEVNTALSVVPYEYMTTLKKGMALDKQDIEKANQLINPDSMTVGNLVTALKGLGHVMTDQMSETNYTFKRTVGTDIPDAHSPQAIQAAKILGINLGGGDNEPMPAVPNAPPSKGGSGGGWDKYYSH